MESEYQDKKVKMQLHILIVEDEPPIARHIEWCCRNLLKEKISSIKITNTLNDAIDHISKNKVDLCLLDLNLKGRNGFDLLKQVVSFSFHTIIISAYTDQAVIAFEYGVLDFVPKPFTDERLQNAFNRYFSNLSVNENKLKYLVIRKQNVNQILQIENILYFKAAGFYVEAHLHKGGVEIVDKHLNNLEKILPDRFLRTHRSYIVDLELIDIFKHEGGGKYQLTLKNGEMLPLNRHQYKTLQNHFK